MADLLQDDRATAALDALDRRLLDAFQRDFPLTSRPFAEIGRRLGLDEASVLRRLERLQRAGLVSRVGPVLAPHRAGWSTLAAMVVPAPRLDEVAALVSDFEQVNHNYEREHAFNLWFVVTAADRAGVGAVLAKIEAATDLTVLSLPLQEAFRIDLGFALRWD
jgi:siroheme decarboxylase